MKFLPLLPELLLAIATVGPANAADFPPGVVELVNCFSSGQVAYRDAFSIAQALDASSEGTEWQAGIPMRSLNAEATYFNKGWGSRINTDLFGQLVLDITQGCWTQSGQANNLPGAGYASFFVGNRIAGVVCVNANGATNNCPH
ncbi:hypothetical protein NKR19_g5424 [Coniochaeta hoffmannii]|uniref:Uncharacterized protein n=1 Tax=Coniochaeta hoffmannii TaxID=91930 RepID=A0AA38VSU9_9PEZI|nr:hypothetical protein NKR19_g5424 [Coniochaeta hoffmannii]